MGEGHTYCLEVRKWSFVAGLSDELHGLNVSPHVLERQLSTHDPLYLVRTAENREQELGAERTGSKN